MPLSTAFGPLLALDDATKLWRMSVGSVHFLLFLPVMLAVTYLLPQRCRRAWLLLASYYFYFFAAPSHLPVLVAGTLFTYVMGRFIANTKTTGGKRIATTIGIIGSIGALALFKYSRFFTGSLPTAEAQWFTIAAAVGISYYTFAAVGYIIDVSQGTVTAEKNLITYALYLGFFPYVTMGPIPRADKLLPQLKAPATNFDTARATNALRLMAIGFFKKLAVADTISVFVKAVYASPEALRSYSGFTLTMAAVGFSIQLYFDFSGYTDIVRGAAQLLGIDIPENFQNPHFATNFSGFWARWHMSLSSWLQDYIFTPLVWSRWTEKLPFIGKLVKKPPVLTSIFVVFFVSGLWHGDTLPFVVWGVLQAVFRIGEELLHRTIGKPKKKIILPKRIGKNMVVLILWVESLVFFAVGLLTKGGSIGDAFYALCRQFSDISFIQTAKDIWDAVYSGVYGNKFIVIAFLLFTLLCTAFALWADWAQCFKLKGGSLATALGNLRPAVKWVIYYILMLCCFGAFLLQNGGYGGAFLYGGF